MTHALIGLAAYCVALTVAGIIFSRRERSALAAAHRDHALDVNERLHAFDLAVSGVAGGLETIVNLTRHNGDEILRETSAREELGRQLQTVRDSHGHEIRCLADDLTKRLSAKEFGAPVLANDLTDEELRALVFDLHKPDASHDFQLQCRITASKLEQHLHRKGVQIGARHRAAVDKYVMPVEEVEL